MTIAAGSRLGPYEILVALGAGGMGEVYRARDGRLGREVAGKVLSEEFSSDPDRRKRFEQEARSASALNHPNIVTIHEIGSSDSTTYIAMELVDGRTLREVLHSGPLPTRRLLDLAFQVADGLAKAHSAGIVHRDLKPENVMVSRDGVVKILDFGLAKLMKSTPDESSHLPTTTNQTKAGTVLGTVGYMSPEQASGKPLDFRSDQFSLGAILYEIATGKRAFQRGTAAETLTAIIREEPEPPATLNPAIPTPFRWILERCLQKDPEERYASTRDLARDIKSIREHLSDFSESSSTGETLRPGAAKRTSPGRRRLLRVAVSAGDLSIGGDGDCSRLRIESSRNLPGHPRARRADRRRSAKRRGRHPGRGLVFRRLGDARRARRRREGAHRVSERQVALRDVRARELCPPFTEMQSDRLSRSSFSSRRCRNGRRDRPHRQEEDLDGSVGERARPRLGSLRQRDLVQRDRGGGESVALRRHSFRSAPSLGPGSRRIEAPRHREKRPGPADPREPARWNHRSVAGEYTRAGHVVSRLFVCRGPLAGCGNAPLRRRGRGRRRELHCSPAPRRPVAGRPTRGRQCSGSVSGRKVGALDGAGRKLALPAPADRNRRAKAGSTRGSEVRAGGDLVSRQQELSLCRQRRGARSARLFAEHRGRQAPSDHAGGDHPGAPRVRNLPGWVTSCSRWTGSQDGDLSDGRRVGPSGPRGPRGRVPAAFHERRPFAVRLEARRRAGPHLSHRNRHGKAGGLERPASGRSRRRGAHLQPPDHSRRQRLRLLLRATALRSFHRGRAAVEGLALAPASGCIMIPLWNHK